MSEKKFEATLVHSGQYRRYDDFYREWEIKTDASAEETLEWCFENLCKRRIPESAEWHKNVRYGGEKSGDMGYYFAGYYTMHPIPEGFYFKVCEPYCD